MIPFSRETLIDVSKTLKAIYTNISASNIEIMTNAHLSMQDMEPEEAKTHLHTLLKACQKNTETMLESIEYWLLFTKGVD